MKNKFGKITSKRSRELLECARERVKTPKNSPKQQNWTKAFFELYQHEPLRKRQAEALAYAMINEPVIVREDEQLTGMIYQGVEGSACCDLGGSNFDPRWTEFDCLTHMYSRRMKELPEIIPFTGKTETGNWITPANTAPGHIGWHWEWILKDGINGLLQRIDTAMLQADTVGKETFEGMRIMLNAVLEWNRKHIAALEKLDSSQDRLKISQRVPEFGARNFKEAVQSFYFSYLATMYENPHGGNGPGRLDYHLWPYLGKDLENGIETLESVRELIDELFIRFHERLMFERDGWVETIVVGGSCPDGSSAVNPLSYIMIESIAALKITHPSVYIRLPEHPPEDFIDLAAKDLAHGGNRAQVLSDSAIMPSMVEYSDMPLADAAMYMCGGCMEIAPQGMNSDLLFTGFFNVAKVLECVLTGGKCLVSGIRMFDHLEKSLADFATFEELYAAFESELKRILTITFKNMDISSEEFARYRPRFLISSQLDDCIAKGRIMHDGGARYEDYGSTPLAIPNTADSLHAIKIAIFDEKFISGAEMLETLQNNYTDNENLRLHLAGLPKYGQGNIDADAMAIRVANTVCDIYHGYRNRWGRHVKPIIMTFNTAPLFGSALGAAPDGRHAGLPVPQGVTPQSSAMTEGITPAILSANSLALERFSGGASTMWDLDEKFATPENLKHLVKTFVATGGQIYQGNTTDVNELLAAQKDPELHHNLMVRIGGYSGRFTALDDDLQNEIINRTRHKS
jgi:trans-4-hydroxy-L-proline dehydratase